MQIRNVYVIHGYQATSQSHWFPWLKKVLRQQGIDVHVLDLPHSSEPNLDAWLSHLQANITEVDERTYFIGHSLGCITLLRYLEQSHQIVGGVILVAGFAEPLSFLPALDAFTSQPLDAANIIQHVPQRLVMAATDDYIVPYPYSLRLAERLEAEWELFERGGHFMQDDGFSEFPALQDALNDMGKTA